MPVLWILVLFALSFILKNEKRRKQLRIWSLGLLVFFTNPFLGNLAENTWERAPVLIRDLPVYDAGIVLTGITINRDFPKDRVFLSRGADRIMHALLLYRRGKIKKFLITGGSGSINPRESTEARDLREILLLAQVPEQDILLEEQSRNTRENALFTKKILDQNPQIKSTILITSAFHMRRAEACFNKVGLQPAIFPVDFYADKKHYTLNNLIIPNEQTLNNWSVLLHEITGFCVYKLLGYC